MRPNDTPAPASDDQRGSLTPPVRSHTVQHDAVANITREQIDRIYSGQTVDSSPRQTNAYQRSHQESHTLSPEWQRYHSSWQDYYQKYYERYYVSEAQRAHNVYKQHIDAMQQSGARPAPQPEPQVAEAPSMSQDEALYDLRSQLLEKVQTSAKNVRKSRHFIPIASGVAVLLIFSFIQYNASIFAYAKAYVSPGNVDPQNIIVDPNTSVSVSKAPRLIIPKINVDVNVDYNAKNCNDCPGGQLEAMENGVAYFGIPGANSKPGQYGNVPISGHSSNDVLAPGDADAKFIFAQLEQLKLGDTFYLNYQGTRYTYSITKRMTVKPSEVSKLQVGTKKPMATLITCTPLGTAEKRLLLFGEQISPTPSKASKAPTKPIDTEQAPQLTGKSPTLFEQLFGG